MKKYNLNIFSCSYKLNKYNFILNNNKYLIQDDFLIYFFYEKKSF